MWLIQGPGFEPQYHINWAQTPVTPALRKWSPEDQKVKVTLCYIENLRQPDYPTPGFWFCLFIDLGFLFLMCEGKKRTRRASLYRSPFLPVLDEAAA